MKVEIFEDSADLAAAAAKAAAAVLRDTIATKGNARIIAATGASQFTFLKLLVSMPGIDWTKAEMFHLDEYLELPITHPASFRKYLLERLIGPAGIKHYHLLNGEDVASCERTAVEINCAPIDIAFLGIGENGHLAFNDPPADFETNAAFLIVELDDACRRQQVGEGWFASLSEVPRRAITMSIRQILKSKKILCIVPDERKASAVRDSLKHEIRPEVPASILRTHPDTTLFLDKFSASLLEHQDRTTMVLS